jgi:EmrB/QacA subfamily drug resistance transporter
MQKPKRGDTVGFYLLVATICASSMAFIMQGSLNAALPAIQTDLAATGVDLLWIVNSFQLLLGALILVGGSLGDLYGRKRIFTIGILIFTAASIACGLAPTTNLLIAARAVQGIGGALMVPGSLAIIAAYFEGEARGKAIGTWSAFTTMTSVIGPTLGGFFADSGLWRAIFWLVLPLAAVALWALRLVPESHDEEAPHGLDIPGAILITLGLAGIVYGATEIGRTGEFAGNGLLALIAGLVFSVIFVFVEARSSHPMMPLALFRSRTFSGANLLTLFLYGALGGALFFLPLNLVQVQGYSAAAAGAAFLPFSILLILLSRWAGGLVMRYGARLPLTVGPVLVGFGFAALSLPGLTKGADDYWTTYFPGLLLMGVGMGVLVAPLTTTVMTAAPSHHAGVASGINNAVSRAAGVLATAIMGGLALVIFAGTLTAALEPVPLPDTIRTEILADASNLADTRVPAMDDVEMTAQAENAVSMAFVATFRVMMWIGAGLSWLSALLALLLIESPPKGKRTV